MTPHRLPLALVALLLLSCDPVWSLGVEVSISPETQAESATSFPAQVLLTMEKRHMQDDPVVKPDATGPFQLAVICEPHAETVTTGWDFDGLGCSTETLVTGWLAPWTSETGASCEDRLREDYEASGAPGVPTDVENLPPPDVAQDSRLAFVDEEDANCRGSADTVELILASP